MASGIDCCASLYFMAGGFDCRAALSFWLAVLITTLLFLTVVSGFDRRAAHSNCCRCIPPPFTLWPAHFIAVSPRLYLASAFVDQQMIVECHHAEAS